MQTFYKLVQQTPVVLQLKLGLLFPSNQKNFLRSHSAQHSWCSTQDIQPRVDQHAHFWQELWFTETLFFPFKAELGPGIFNACFQHSCKQIYTQLHCVKKRDTPDQFCNAECDTNKCSSSSLGNFMCKWACCMCTCAQHLTSFTVILNLKTKQGIILVAMLYVLLGLFK